MKKFIVRFVVIFAIWMLLTYFAMAYLIGSWDTVHVSPDYRESFVFMSSIGMCMAALVSSDKMFQ